MHWTYANSRPALTLRRWLAARGVGTPPVLVRTRLPLALRLTILVPLFLASLAAGAWIYEAGGRLGGFNREEAERELNQLRGRVAQLDQQVSALRGSSDSSAAALQIEHTTQQMLTAKIRDLELDNARLREDLSFFDSLAEGPRKATDLSIARLEVRAAEQPGQYRYRLLAIAPGGKEREFDGVLQLVVTLESSKGASKLVLPRSDDPDRQHFRIHFKHFRRVDGTFTVPQEEKPRTVEARLIQNGTTKASKSLKM